MGVLRAILDTKWREIAELEKQALPPAPARRAIQLTRSANALHLIGEIKHKSPSAGELSRALSVGERARAYEAGGLKMISVLTDTPFFGGSYADLQAARATTNLPLLCKDFILHERQLDAARAHGADAVLLIVRCLNSSRLRELVAAAQQRDLEPLVEIIDDAEAAQALAAGATFIGVNARDLDTLQMDRARAERVLATLPAFVTKVHLSGLKTPDDVSQLLSTAADVALLGEALMRAADPLPLVSSLVAAAQRPH